MEIIFNLNVNVNSGQCFLKLINRGRITASLKLKSIIKTANKSFHQTDEIPKQLGCIFIIF